jgi:molybdopterin biosynthesis enzyme
VLKSGTVQSSPTSLNKLSTKPVVCLSATPKSTFIVKHVWTAASL